MSARYALGGNGSARRRVPRNRRRSETVRILVEPSDYRLHNMGDRSMLLVAVSRLADMWPQTEVQVFSEQPDELRALSPDAVPIPVTGRELWLRDDFLPGRLIALARQTAISARLVDELPRWIRRTNPAVVEAFWRWKLRARPTARENLSRFTHAAERADLMVVAGMGGVTDAFPGFARGVLDVMNLAIHRGATVAMVGQGFGPLVEPMLLAQARSILPRVDLITLREERASRPLLQSLGVRPERILTTGDDAIELAYRLRRKSLAHGLGVNLRLSDYSGVGETELEALREVLQQAAAAKNATMVPVPISTLPTESDIQAISRLLDGYSDVRLVETPNNPIDVIDLVNKCRLLVTGSYHAGVFALSSGIPAIGLAKSTYYIDKFRGLAAQFGDSCEVVLLDDRKFPLRLREAIDKLWASADELRPHLLESASRQIALGQAAYRRIREIVELKRGRQLREAAD